MDRELSLILCALWLLLSGANQAQAQGQMEPAGPAAPPYYATCPNVTEGSATSQIATAVADKRIYVCGFDLEATAASGAFTLAYGSGSVCSTKTADLSPVYSGLGAGAVIVDHVPYGLKVPADTNVCVTSATSVVYVVYWGQY
jgi:hypothetical protein